MGAVDNAFSVGFWLITLQIIAGFLIEKETVLLLLSDMAGCSSRGVGSGKRGRRGLEVAFMFHLNILLLT